MQTIVLKFSAETRQVKQSKSLDMNPEAYC